MKAKEVLSRQGSIVQWQSVEAGIFSSGTRGWGDTLPPKKDFFNVSMDQKETRLKKAFYFLVPPPPPHIFKHSAGPAPSAPRASFWSASRP